MRQRASRRLVIDASVVQSAGGTEHPVSSASRKCLLAVLNVCHRVVVTEALRDEWRRHMSRLSRKWQRSMAAHRKPIDTVSPAGVPLKIGTFPVAARSAIEKDLCLLQAAFAADRVIVTLDDSLRTALTQAPGGVRVLGSLIWINPVTDGPSAIESL